MHYRTLPALAALAGCCLILPGCLIVSGKSFDESGVRISDSTFQQVEIGQTSEAWVRATLGEPSSCVDVEGSPGVRVLRYEYVETHKSGGAVFLIFAGGSEKTHRSSSYFEFTDGVLTRYWVEE